MLFYKKTGFRLAAEALCCLSGIAGAVLLASKGSVFLAFATGGVTLLATAALAVDEVRGLIEKRRASDVLESRRSFTL